MRRHGMLGAALAGGLLAAGYFDAPVEAQRNRVPPSGEASSSGGAPARAPAPAQAERPPAERSAVQRAPVERPQSSRESQVITAPPARPAGLVAVQPDPSTRGGGGSNAAGRQNAGASATGRNDNRGSWQDDQHSGDDRHDNGGRHDNGSRHDGDRPVAAYSGRGGIVIEPIVIREVYVGSVRLSPATTIGQRVVIGGGATPGSVAVGPGRGYVSAPVMAWSEETIYLDDGRQEQRLVASDEPVSDPAELPHTPPDAAQTRAMLPSLAALGPAYTFRPWYAVSEFIMAGYPSPYPEALAVTYDKRALAANADLAPAAADALQAGRPLVPYEPGTFGGLVFQIGPSDAAIYVDDVYVGLVEDFTPGVAPLPLPVGPHRLELRARGYRVEAFEVIVTVGQVTPLSGLMAVAN